MRVASLAATLFAVSVVAARPQELSLRRVDLDLPGPPSLILPVDLDGDGRKDLLVVTAYTQWGSIAKDRVENAVAVTEVVPALFDERKILPFLARPDGTYRAGPAFDMPKSWIALAAGSGPHAAIALTDDGLEALDGSADGTLTSARLIDEPSAFEGARTFLSSFEFLQDADGDGVLDAIVPARDGIAIHRGTKDGSFEAKAATRLRLPEDVVVGGRRNVPVVKFLDVDGDGKLDLVSDGLDGWPGQVSIARGEGGARFAAPRTVTVWCLSDKKRRAAWFGELAPGARPSFVTREQLETGKSDRKEAMKPQMRYGVHTIGADLAVPAQAATTFDAEGYAFTGAFEDGVDLQFIDLDGDGRRDLVTVTVDVGMWQMLRALTSKKIGIGLDFRVYAQDAQGGFHLVPDQVLHEKLNLDLNRFEISRLGQFQGDFDGDGRIDFVHLGKGKTITIHRGEPGGRYPEKPDLAIELQDEPEDVMLVRVRDFDGDGRSDIAVTRTLDSPEAGASARAKIELYLSGTPK
ncbi:MAG TPA: VCBS repeat-containing protein [Candidatus Polarisedimenticolaceae bacterium]|nr:VCBS repeat-containing protein [Candidatus Polarisedimenticolaceae bacterium]